MAYQSFADRPGGSRSSQKLLSLCLPPDLSRNSVLDLGCNEGFFSLEAVRRGATAVGIDQHPPFIESAKERAKNEGVDVDFRVGNVTDKIDGNFNIILMLSMLHYIDKPALLFKSLLSNLKPGGRIILECGVAHGHGKSPIRALRSIDERFFPTWDLLVDVWLSDYAVRLVSESTPQDGDPIPRYVFHAQARLPIVQLIAGNSNDGKSVFAQTAGSVPVISLDYLLLPVRGKAIRHNAIQTIWDAERNSLPNRSPEAAWAKLRENADFRRSFVKMIASAICCCAPAPHIVVEGFQLADIVSDLRTELGNEFRIWETRSAMHEKSTHGSAF